MRLSTGDKLGPYEITGLIGKGGMGEVYSGTDTRLGRPVAIKVSSREFNDRFEREAKAISALNHPNICTLYDIGPNYLVMEFVEGEMLSKVIEHGPLPLDKALSHAVQIVDALAAAHAKGVIHRDLKPGNIIVTKNGVKVLDFGLAKLSLERLPTGSGDNIETLTEPITRAGAVLGTLFYMSPEQVEGKDADERSDIFSFGVVFYEMITGQRPFTGDTQAAVLASLMKDAPAPISQRQPAVPRALERIVRKCLEKKREDRWRSAHDLKPTLELIDLDAPPMSSASSSVPVPVQVSDPALPKRELRIGLWPAVAGGLAIVAAAAAWALWPETAAPVAEPVRFEIAQAGNTSLLSISPDGRRLAFIGVGADRRTSLWIRNMSTLEAHPLEGTDGATGNPFWSPDSRNVVFSSGGKLKKIEATGGPSQTLCDLPVQLRGGFWTQDNRIVFSDASQPIMQVAAAGGTPIPITARATSGGIGGISFGFPSLLPDGKHFVYMRNGGADAGIYLGELGVKPEEQASKRLLADARPVGFSPSPDPARGYLLFVRGNAGVAGEAGGGTLMAQEFDTRRLEISGEPVPVAEDVSPVAFSASSNGVLVYRPGATLAPAQQALNTGVRGQLTWFDRSGKVLGTAGEVQNYGLGIVLSPDATRVAMSYGQQGNTDVWIFEFARGVSTRFTFDPAVDVSPAWSPDGSKIVFSSNRGNKWGFYQKSANGAGAEELIFTPEIQDRSMPTEMSRDGRFLTYYASQGGINFDSYAVSISGSSSERKGIPLVAAQFNERGARFSPDGKWFSYTSNESGKDEAYVRPFDTVTGKLGDGQFMISKDGGASPKWRGDGKEMFYLAPDGTIMSVEITTTPVFKAEAPKPLFKGPGGVVYWDTARDGKRFLMPVPQSANSPAPYRVVLNWTSTIKK